MIIETRRIETGATTAALRVSGDEWSRSLTSMVLQVPSAIVPDELNYLINPIHPDYSLTGSIEIGDPVTFEIDLRQLR